MTRYFDHHCHNGHSRCVKVPYSIEDGLNRALDRGFVEGIGITNHCHMNSPEQEHLKQSREEIDKINQERRDEKVLLGVELDIDHPSGKFVLKKESLELVDYVLAGPHNMPHKSLAFPDMEREDFDEYFGVLHDILVNSLDRNPINIIPHPFLQEIEIGGVFFEKEIFNILPDVLSILAEKGIAMEISSTFHRDKQGTVEIFALGNKDDSWIQIIKMTSKIYQEALRYADIMFSFGSDAHGLENAGDIFTPILISRVLKIPGKRIMHLKDFVDSYNKQT
ncbi:MAG: hypothetical protein ACFFCS_00575 [Candidatus Hodarchaeota archaeon]